MGHAGMIDATSYIELEQVRLRFSEHQSFMHSQIHALSRDNAVFSGESYCISVMCMLVYGSL